MKRETREVPNQFARQRNEYVSEETARAGKFRIRNVSEDQLQTYWRRNLITARQYDAGRIFQHNYRMPRLIGSYAAPVGGEKDLELEKMAEHQRACKALKESANIEIEVCLRNNNAGHMHPKGLDLLRDSLDKLAVHYGLSNQQSEGKIQSMSTTV